MTIKTINKYIRTPFTTFMLLGNVLRQQRFINRHILPELEPYRKSKDDSLTEKDFKKITSYYGFGVPAVLGEAICALRGKSMTFNERMASTAQGAITGLFDDFFDEWGIPEDKLIRLVNEPEKVEPENANQELFLKYYIRSLELCKYPDNVKASLIDVLHAQTDSLLQAGGESLSVEEIKRITFQKGGLSLVFYRHIFDHELSEKEYECLFMLGAALQLVNDSFDVYKDYKAGVQTLVTRAVNISDVKNVYNQWINEFFKLAMKLDYPITNKEKLIRMISLGVRRADVCLDQLEDLELKTDNKFKLEKYERKDLIVDMDKVGNIMKSVAYHIRINPFIQ